VKRLITGEVEAGGSVEKRRKVGQQSPPHFSASLAFGGLASLSLGSSSPQHTGTAFSSSTAGYALQQQVFPSIPANYGVGYGGGYGYEYPYQYEPYLQPGSYVSFFEFTALFLHCEFYFCYLFVFVTCCWLTLLRPSHNPFGSHYSRFTPCTTLFITGHWALPRCLLHDLCFSC
jgi:hypothetical protein